MQEKEFATVSRIVRCSLIQAHNALAPGNSLAAIKQAMTCQFYRDWRPEMYSDLVKP